MPDVANVNGRVSRLSAARVSVRDRGFLFADGVYEVLRTYDGRIFEFDRHLDRLRTSLHGLQLRAPWSGAALGRLLADLHRRTGSKDVRFYIQVTRGAGPRRHAFPRRMRPTWVAWAEAIPSRRPRRPPPGVGIVTLPDPRWARCDLKCVALVANVLAKQAAQEQGAHDAVFVGPRGAVREATTANVFVVLRGQLWTRELGPHILPGVSRAVVLELARAEGLRVREARVPARSLATAEEVFLSSTMQEILPVVRVDGRRIADGRVGPVTEFLWRRFQEYARRTPAPRRRSR